MANDLDLADLAAFIDVAETGSFASAAERAGMSKSIISRRVARLEDRLGARLLTRTAQGAQPTDIGRSYHARAAAILADLDAAGEAVAEAVSEVAGPIRLAAPLTFGTLYLAPALADFAALHPRVALEVSLEDRVTDLVGGGYDLALRIGSLPDSSLIARRIAPVRGVTLASPDYLERRGTPLHPRDIADHDVLVYTNNATPALWRFPDGDDWHQVQGKVRLRADNGELLRDAAIAGLGIVQLPSFIAADAIAARQLLPILLDYPLKESALHAVRPPGRAATARIRALIDFLAERFGPEPAWDPCWTAAHRETRRA